MKFILVFTLYFIPILLIGDISPQSNYVEVGRRPVSEATFEKLFQQEAKPRDLAWNLYHHYQTDFGNSHPDATRYLLSDFEPLHSLVQLSDGSQWKVFSKDLLEVDSWSEEHPLIIESNDVSWLKNCCEKFYIYHLTNLKRKKSVDVFLYRGPSYNNPLYSQVDSIDLKHNQVTLITQDNRTTWNLFVEDVPLLEEWVVGDAILQGSLQKMTNSTSTKEFRNLLINVDSNHYVRAKKSRLNKSNS